LAVYDEEDSTVADTLLSDVEQVGRVDHTVDLDRVDDTVVEPVVLVDGPVEEAERRVRGSLGQGHVTRGVWQVRYIGVEARQEAVGRIRQEQRKHERVNLPRADAVTGSCHEVRGREYLRSRGFRGVGVETWVVGRRGTEIRGRQREFHL